MLIQVHVHTNYVGRAFTQSKRLQLTDIVTGPKGQPVIWLEQLHYHTDVVHWENTYQTDAPDEESEGIHDVHYKMR